MDELSKQRNIDAVDALMDAQDECKERLEDREAIFAAVSYLRIHGYSPEEVSHCLVRCFYVDLDLLREALAIH